MQLTVVRILEDKPAEEILKVGAIGGLFSYKWQTTAGAVVIQLQNSISQRAAVVLWKTSQDLNDFFFLNKMGRNAFI